MVKELLKDIIKYLPARVIPVIVSILVIPVITNLFDPAEYGSYILISSFLSVAYVFTTTWLSASIIRFYSHYENTSKIKEFNNLIIVLIIVSLLIFSIIFIIIVPTINFSFNNFYNLILIFLILIFNSIHMILLNIHRAERKVNYYTFFSLWSGIVSVIAGIILVKKLKFGIEGMFLGSLISLIIIIPIQIKLSFNKMSFNNLAVDLHIAKEMISYGLPVIIINFSGWVLSLSDRYFIEYFCGLNEVGIYSISYLIAERSITFISSLLLLSSDPIKFIVWETKGVEASKIFLRDITRMYIIIGFPAVVGISVLAKKILCLLSSPLYYDGYKIIPLVVFGGFLSGFEARFGAPLDFYKRTDLSMLYFLYAAIFNVMLNFFLVPIYGAMGAAVSTILSYSFLILLTLFTTKKMLYWRFPFLTTFKVVIASIFMGLTISLIGNIFASNVLDLIFKVFLGIFTYIFYLHILKEFTSEEARKILSIINCFKKETVL